MLIPIIYFSDASREKECVHQLLSRFKDSEGKFFERREAIFYGINCGNQRLGFQAFDFLEEIGIVEEISLEDLIQEKRLYFYTPKHYVMTIKGQALTDVPKGTLRYLKWHKEQLKQASQMRLNASMSPNIYSTD